MLRMETPFVVEVGPYKLQLPAFFERGSVRKKPGFAGYNTTVGDVSFALNVLDDLGRDAAERARLVEALVTGYAPERHLVRRSTFQGIALEEHRLEETAALGPGSVYELCLCEAYGDLLQLGFGFFQPQPKEESLRHLFLTLLAGAIVDRGYALHSR